MAQVLDEAGKPALGVLDGKPIIKSYARSAFLYVFLLAYSIFVFNSVVLSYEGRKKRLP